MINDPTYIVTQMSDDAVSELLRLVNDHAVSIVRAPRSALVMMPLIDSFEVAFNLGEVLVTDATVSIDGVEGYGMVVGDCPRRALARAAAAAVLNRGCGPLYDTLVTLLESQERAYQAIRVQEQALVSTTRVNFDLMPGA